MIEQAGKIVGDGVRLIIAHTTKTREREWDRENTSTTEMAVAAPSSPSAPAAPGAPTAPQRLVATSAPVKAAPASGPVLANTDETLAELKRRLGKELYKLELDLQGGGRIAGKPCDCLSSKHDLGLEATAEELMSYDKNPVYGQVIAWMKERATVFQPAEIVKHEPKFYQQMTPEVRAFRKTVMGTEKVQALLSSEEKQKAMSVFQKTLES